MKNLISVFLVSLSLIIFAQEKCDWEGGVPEGCTTITVGKKASIDGSVMTSHTDDSHRTRSWVDIQPAKKYKVGDKMTMYKRSTCDTLAMPAYQHTPIGSIPQALQTYQYVNTAYPSMNEKQLAIGESTFGGRPELKSDKGIIDCQRLCQILLERCTNARQAIHLADSLTKEYGWNDDGECLTIADTKEVWHFEIVGPGKDKVGAVWVAQRVPDEHISVNANASTIKEINLEDHANFLASENIYKVGQEMGYYNPTTDIFKFAYVYAPRSRQSVASRRREWRILDLMAPNLHLNPNDKDFPFSVKPEKKVALADMVVLFQDYYEGTPYDMTSNITTTNKEGKQVVSPLANPFMPYDAYAIQKVNGGWYYENHKTGNIRFLGERTIARWYTMYGTIIQLRDWLPDDVGGVLWLAQDNIATSVYIPVYAGTTDLPKSYKTPGRVNGFTHESAWWAFNRLGTLTAQRWGEARYDVEKTWKPLQQQLFQDQSNFEKQVLSQKSDKKRKIELTQYTLKWGNTVVDKAWKLGDSFWTKYDEKF